MFPLILQLVTICCYCCNSVDAQPQVESSRERAYTGIYFLAATCRQMLSSEISSMKLNLILCLTQLCCRGKMTVDEVPSGYHYLCISFCFFVTNYIFFIFFPQIELCQSSLPTYVCVATCNSKLLAQMPVRGVPTPRM